MADHLNPAEKTASDRDYEKKFKHNQQSPDDPETLKTKEASIDSSWQNGQKSETHRQSSRKKRGLKIGLFGAAGLRKGSAFVFIIGFILAGVWYTSVLAPNILLVNVKEMYTNDLADATTALDIYTQLMFTFKIGPEAGQDCVKGQEVQSIKCKLTTMSRSQKNIFEKQGWIVFADKVYEDSRDDNDKKNDKPESRYKVNALLPPRYKDIVDRAAKMGIKKLEDITRSASTIQGGINKIGEVADGAGQEDWSGKAKSALSDAGDYLNQLLGLPSNPGKKPQAMFTELMGAQPIVFGPQLWMYSQLSTAAKEQVWGVFNPRSSFYHDARFRQRIHSRYNMYAGSSIGGSDFCAVGDAFNKAVNKADGGIDLFTGQPNPTNGISLASLSGGVANIWSGIAAITCDLTQDSPLAPVDTDTIFGNFMNKNASTDKFNEQTKKYGLDGSRLKEPNLNISNLVDAGKQLSSNAGALQGDISGVLSQLKSLYIPNNLTEVADKLPFVADLEAAGNILATNTYSYTDLMCSWFTIGNMANNALIRAKASTAARFAMQYLKAADSIKAGTSDVIGINTLSGKLAQDSFIAPLPDSPLGVGYGGGRGATDSLIYNLIAYGSSFVNVDLSNNADAGGFLGGLLKGFVNGIFNMKSIMLYNLAGYENSLLLAPSWAQILPNAVALGGAQATNASKDGGILLPPPVNVGGKDKLYCETGEKLANKVDIKGQTTDNTRCPAAVVAMMPAIINAAADAISELARKTCPPTNPRDDNLLQILNGQWRGPVQFLMLPTQKVVQATGTPYVAGWFGVNTMIAASLLQALYSSQTTGLDANYALFSGMGELLGDMAMSRGLMPSDPGSMLAYLTLGELLSTRNGYDDIAKARAKQNPFDPYNRFSFMGSMVRGLSPKANSGSPLFGTIENVFSLFSGSIGHVARISTANAFYQSQPNMLTLEGGVGRLASYAVRLFSCPFDLQQVTIGIFPDIMCNVRYSMPLTDIGEAINLSKVIDYMTTPRPEVYKSQTDELEKRISQADGFESGNLINLTAQDALIRTTIQNKPFIDKNTGKPTAGSEYEKYLQYCVNRLDPWGHSAVGIRYQELPEAEKTRRFASKKQDLQAFDKNAPGDPYQKIIGGVPIMAVTATQSDQDWYTGKKCTTASMLTQDSVTRDMITMFRVFTMLCSVDGSMSGIADCTEPDRGSDGAYVNPFYLNNDILFSSWY